MNDDTEIMESACSRAVDAGATVAGYIPVSLLKDCPSAISDGNPEFVYNSGSFLIIGLYHSPEIPEMDFREKGKGTPGDQEMEGILTRIFTWLTLVHGKKAKVIPYQIYDGGIYLKDAAVLAGMGVVGRNNLVLVPGYGPLIRFRALWTDLEPGNPDNRKIPLPCSICGKLCMKNCPMNAFPNGSYSRTLCLKRMDLDKAESDEKKMPAVHCRMCELTCPAATMMR